MLTLSILWLVLAASVIVIAILRKASAKTMQESGLQTSESGEALSLLAVIYGVALLAGFVCVGKFLVSGF